MSQSAVIEIFRKHRWRKIDYTFKLCEEYATSLKKNNNLKFTLGYSIWKLKGTVPFAIALSVIINHYSTHSSKNAILAQSSRISVDRWTWGNQNCTWCSIIAISQIFRAEIICRMAPNAIISIVTLYRHVIGQSIASYHCQNKPFEESCVEEWWTLLDERV